MSSIFREIASQLVNIGYEQLLITLKNYNKLYFSNIKYKSGITAVYCKAGPSFFYTKHFAFDPIF